MTAIPCSSVGLRTMADGTLRVSFDFEPANAQDAFRLFGSPGTPAAVAALQVGYAQQDQQKPKGGPISKLAGMWCLSPAFHAWLTEMGHPASDPQSAADCVRDMCGVISRADLDHDKDAADRFHKLIREPFSQYMQGDK